MLVLSVILLIISLFSTEINCALTLDITGQLAIPSGPHMILDGTAAAGLKVTLNGHQYTTYTLRNGSFSFPHVPTGIYLLEVLSIHDQFSSVKLKVSAETGVIKAAEYKYPGSKRYAIEYPLFMTAIAPVMYFQQHPPFSIIGIILGNPMLIMMAFSFVVVLFIPMLMNNLSEEELKEIQENSPGDPMKMMQSMLGVPSESKAIDDE